MPHDSENYMTRRATGVALITLGILLCAVVIVVLRVQWNSPLTRWLAAIADLLMSFGVDMDVRVLSLCACATLISGLLFLTSDSSKAAIIGWQLARFVLHLAAVYAIAGYGPRLAGWTRNVVLPLIQRPTSSSSFEFLFSHIFAFSFVPALFAGLTNAASSTKLRNMSGSSQPLFWLINSPLSRHRCGLFWITRLRVFQTSQVHFTNTSAVIS